MIPDLHKTDGGTPGRRSLRTEHALALLLFLLASLLRLSARRLPGFADFYSAHVNPLLVHTVARFFGLFPFSFAELLLFSALPLLLFLFVRRLAARVLPLLCSALFLLFELNGDVYFFRTGFAPAPSPGQERCTTEELYDACSFLTEEVNRLAELVPRDASGLMLCGPDLSPRMCASMQALGESSPFLGGIYPPPKSVRCSELLTRAELSGIYCFFTAEANYNREMPAYNLPFTIAHELSHVKGIADEREANYLAYLACVNSPDPDIAYSGALIAWIYCTNELTRRDIHLWYEISTLISEAAKLDLYANTEFWDSHHSEFSDRAQELNDAFLKAQGVEDGTLSYDLVTDLIAAHCKIRQKN